MSIASELNRLLQAKSDLATSIANKGVTVPAATTLDGYAALVNQIQQGGGTLPYDAEVDYIESTGTQYIDTGVILNGSSFAELTLSISAAQNNGMFGARSAYKVNDFSWMILSSNKNRRNYGTQENTSGGAINLNYINNYRAEANVYKGNWNVAYTFTSQAFQTPGSAYICAINDNGTVLSPSKMRVFRCAIRGVNKSVDLIPVRVGQVGCMYDKISGTLLYNAGTGSFTVGTDVIR